MNLLHHQEYLTAMGINYYIPRRSLPFAAQSPEFFEEPIFSLEEKENIDEIVEPSSYIEPVNNLLQDMFDENKKERRLVAVQSIPLAEAQTAIQPFSLSVWRPEKGFLVIANRDGRALPTELLAHNIFRYYFKKPQLKLDEEILRWPATGSMHLGFQKMDACNELQTWLSVQHELQPLEQIWFFGDVWQYFTESYSDPSYQLLLGQTAILAKCFPELADILLSPQLKADLLGRL